MSPSVRSALRASVAAAALATSVVLTTGGVAEASTATWSPSGPCGTVSTTTSPANTVSMNVAIAGGAGGKGGGQSSGTTGPGGFGGTVIAVIPLAAGSTISAVVGCNGNNGPESGTTPGVPGYAAGGGTGRGQNTAFDPNGAGGGSGGGASAVCLGSTCATGSGTPLAVAGGGGGSGSSSCSGTTGGAGGLGGGGSATTAAGGSGPSGVTGGVGASAGSQNAGIAGGGGGVNSIGGDGNGGSSPNGSGGASVNVVGGGGGGGFVGGRAGANANTGCKAGGAGGGGSSWVTSSAKSKSFTTSPSSSVVISFNYGAPTAPRSQFATPGNGFAEVRWAPPLSDGGSPITAYIVIPIIGQSYQPAQFFGPESTTRIVTGLTNGTRYRFKIQALNDGGASTGVYTGEIAPGSPLAPATASVRPGNGSATLKWTPPTSDNSWPVSAYVVTPYIGVTAQPSTTFNTPALTGTVTGLTNGTPYTFRVAAVNQYGAGLQAVTGSIVVGSPNSPPTASAVPGVASATVKWTVPADNGSPITGYVVTPYLGATAQAPRVFNSTATQQVVTGLTSGAQYTFRVAAVNAVGTGTQTVSPAVTIG